MSSSAAARSSSSTAAAASASPPRASPPPSLRPWPERPASRRRRSGAPTTSARAGRSVEQLAAGGLISMAFCRRRPGALLLVERGERRLGTDPIAWATPGRPPLVMDWSSAPRDDARGPARYRRSRRGEQVPHGVLVDSGGWPWRDPAEASPAARCCRCGAHQGSGLSVMIQLVGVALRGAAAPSARGARRRTARS